MTTWVQRGALFVPSETTNGADDPEATPATKQAVAERKLALAHRRVRVGRDELREQYGDDYLAVLDALNPPDYLREYIDGFRRRPVR